MELPKILSNGEPKEQPEPGKAQDAPENRPSVNPMTFAVALTVSAVVSGVLAVLLTLIFIRGDAPPRNAGEFSTASTDVAPDRREAAAESPAAGKDQTEIRQADLEPPSPGIGEPVAPEGDGSAPAGQREAVQPPPARRAEPVSGFTIADTVEVVFGRPSRLAFRLKPENAKRERTLVLFDGLPPGSAIYGLRRLGENAWRLEPGQSAEMLIIVPPDAPRSFSVRMRLERDNGGLIEQRTVRMVAKR